MEETTFENWETLPALTDAEAADVAQACRFVLDAKRGRDIAVIPVAGHSDITDCVVLASATSGTHARSLAGEVEYRLGQRGLAPLHTEAGDGREWLVVDYGIVMVHVFTAEARDFYRLDKLYAEPTASVGGRERQ